MADNIPVNTAIDAGAVDVATDEVTDSDGNITHYPVYKLATGANGEAVLADADNPLPVQATAFTHESDVVTVLNEVSRKLSILIKYEAMLHKIDLEEDL